MPKVLGTPTRTDVRAAALASHAEFADALPTHVYIARDSAGAVLYVGMTGNLRNRIKTHMSTSRWWTMVTELTIETLSSRQEAFTREAFLIDLHDPLYNRTDESWRHRDEVVLALLSLGLTQTDVAWELDIAVAAIRRSAQRLRTQGRLAHLSERRNGKTARQQRTAARRHRTIGESLDIGP